VRRSARQRAGDHGGGGGGRDRVFADGAGRRPLVRETRRPLLLEKR